MKKFIVFLFCIIFISLISYRLLDMSNFYVMELYGFSHLDNELGYVCNFDDVFKKDTITNAVATTREDSLIFTAPSKLLYNYVNPRVTHRLAAIFCLAMSIICLAMLLFKLKITLPLILFILTFYTFSPQFLSYFFEFKLTLTSAMWISLSSLLVVYFYYSIKEKDRIWPHFYSLIIPLVLLNVGYEVFCVSRPVSIFIYCFLFIYLCIYYRKYLISYLFGTTLSIVILKLMHPMVKANLSLFVARGESISIYVGHQPLSDLLSHIKDRVSELHFLFHFPKYNSYISEVQSDTACLDIFTILFVCILLSILFMLFKKTNHKLKENFKENAFIYSFFLSISMVSFAVPLASTAYIRGHRFVTFYFAFTIFSTFFLNSLLNILNKNLLMFGKIFISILTLGLLYFNFNIFLNYNFNKNYNEKDSLLINSINQITGETKNIKTINNITVCDDQTKHEPLFRPSWNGVLYITKLGCKSKRNPPFLIDYSASCKCPKEKDTVCLIRENKKLITLKRF